MKKKIHRFSGMQLQFVQAHFYAQYDFVSLFSFVNGIAEKPKRYFKPAEKVLFT